MLHRWLSPRRIHISADKYLKEVGGGRDVADKFNSLFKLSPSGLHRDNYNKKTKYRMEHE